MSFDYFYGEADAEQFAFYRIPKRLITGDEFQNISTDAKLLYGLMLDRLQLSIRNQWMDDLNRVYIVYTVEDIMADMHCGNQKAVRMLSELEKDVGLIKRKRQGLGKPSLIYVLKFSTSCPQKNQESHFKKCENHTSGDVNFTRQEVWKSHTNKTDINKTENNKTNPINPVYPSADELPESHTEEPDGMDEMGSGQPQEDPMAVRKGYEEYFKKKLEYDCLMQKYPYDHGRINEIIDVLVDTVCSNAKTIRIGGEDRPAEVVKSRFMKLDYGHIEYMMDCFHDNTTEIRNIKKYMLTMLYNASLTIDHYYQAKVSHDMYGSGGW